MALFEGTTSQLELSLTVGSGEALGVRQFTVQERMSSLFVISLEAMSTNPNVDLDGIVGEPARFSLRTGPWERAWSGVCNRLQQVAVEDQGLSTYHLTIVPTLWLATQRRNHRIFQQISELDIVLEMLGEWGIEPVQRLSGKYKKRKYRVQYAESDFAFMSRMLEDQGISYYFEQQGEETKLVLSDAPESRAPRAQKLVFLDRHMNTQADYVTAVRIGKQVRPGRYTMRDHDYRLPADYNLVASAAEDGGAIEQRLEQFHYTPGAFLFHTERGEPTPHADDRGKTRTDEAEANAIAQKRLAARRESALVCTFDSNAIDLEPGVVMSMLDHPHAKLSENQPLLVVETTLSGDVHNVTLSCETRSASSPYRPPLTTRKPKIAGVECATVVGPKGEEIHTDEFGRVRVAFHWDRESTWDERSSCWIHVSQPWGGVGFGGSNLPRIGQEVIVDFLGGDPDRPIITGRVYTNLQKTPYKLPDNKTQSGWKSNTSPTNGGYNELMFEDKQGQELVRFQAEKDHHELVKNDRASTIGNDRTTNIGNDESQSVGNNLMQQVQNSLTEMVGLNRARAVGNDENVQVGRNMTTTVGEVVQIVCGKSSLTMDKDGNITLQGTKITVTGSDHVQVASELIDLN